MSSSHTSGNICQLPQMGLMYLYYCLTEESHQGSCTVKLGSWFWVQTQQTQALNKQRGLCLLCTSDWPVPVMMLNFHYLSSPSGSQSQCSNSAHLGS